MDFCSVNTGITAKAMEIASTKEGFEQFSDNVFDVADKETAIALLNESFGGTVVSLINEKVAINPAENVINAYIFEANKELLKTVPAYMNQVKGVYKDVLSNNAEEALFEIAIQANSSPGEKSGAVNAVGKNLVDVALALYPEARVGDKIESFRFDTLPTVSMIDSTMYSLAVMKDVEGVQQTILNFLKTGEKSMLNKRLDTGSARYYFSKMGNEFDVKRIQSTQEFEQFMHMHNFDQNMFRYDSSVNGFPYLEVNPDFKPKNGDLIKRSSSMDKQKAIVAFLAKRFKLESKIEYISKAEFKERFPEAYAYNMGSAIHNNKVYIFNKASNEVAAEELLHPFIEAVFQNNPKLFRTLLEEAMVNFPLLTLEIGTLYNGKSKAVVEKEIVTQALSRVFSDMYEKEPTGTLEEAVSNFTSWVKSVFYDLLDYFGFAFKVISAENLPFQMTLEEMARVINTSDTAFETIFPAGTTYNKSNETPFFQERMRRYIADKGAAARIEETMTKLPVLIKNMKRSIEKDSLSQRQRAELQTIIDTLEKAHEREDLLSMQFYTIAEVIRVFNVLETELIAFDNNIILDNAEKLAFAMGTYNTAQTLAPFGEMMVELYEELQTTFGKPKELKELYDLISTALSTKEKIESRIQRTIKPFVIDVLVGEALPYVQESVEKLRNEITQLERERLATSIVANQAAILSKIGAKTRALDSILKNAPTKENFVKIFNGEYKDANMLSKIFEAGIANGHPVVQVMMSMIEDIYAEAQQSTLNNRNELHKSQQELIKEENTSVRDQDALNAPIRDSVRIPVSVTITEEGTALYTYKTQDTLVSDVDNEYITQYMEYEMLSSHYIDLLMESYKTKNTDASENYRTILRQIHKDFSKFKTDNVQNKYKDEIREMWGMLDEVVGTDSAGNPMTVRQRTKDAYHELENLELQRDSAATTQDKNNVIKKIKITRAELKALKNPYNKDGTLKTGDEKQVSDVITEYDKKKLEYGSYGLTEQGKLFHTLDMDILKQQFEKGALSEHEYQRKKDLITKTKYTQEYYDLLKQTSDTLDATLEQIMLALDEDPEVNAMFDRSLKDKTKESYEIIKKLVNPYRDEDGIIDGMFMQSYDKLSITRVKEIQQAIEDLKYQASRLKDLSKEELTKLKQFTKEEKLTSPEYKKLVAKQIVIKDFYKRNKGLLDLYTSLLVSRAAFTSSRTTEYYDQAISELKGQLKLHPELIKLSRELVRSREEDGAPPLIIDKRKYIYRGDKWYRVTTNYKKQVEEEMFDASDPLDTGFDAVMALTMNATVELNIRNTDWWEENHYTYYEYNRKTGQYHPTSKPLYIWTITEPKDDKYVMENAPSNAYGTYIVKPDYTNKDYKTIYKNIPSPKPGKFKSDRLEKLSPAYKKYHNTLSTIYNKSQEYLPLVDRMGHVLPAVVKTEGENLVQFTNKALAGTFAETWRTNVGQTDDDTSYLLGGSQKNSRVIPKRFINVMDTTQQSKNMVAAIALFDLHASIHNKTKEKLPVFEGIELASQAVTTQTQRETMDNLTTLQRIKKFISGKANNQPDPEMEVNTDKVSQLSETVTGFINMFVYGQKSKPAIMNLGPLGKIDMQKVIKGFSGFIGKTIFVGNIISAVNNSFSTRLQAIIQSGMRGGLFSATDLAEGQALSFKYTGDLLQDWTKMGNKSLIGQVLDYLQISSNGIDQEITTRSEGTMIKRKLEFLTSAKDISEFEVLFAQIFMPMANATLVKKGDGFVKLSHIEEVFELDKGGNLKIKDDVEFGKDAERRFVKSFRKMGRDIGGAYRSTEQSQFETEWWGHAATFMRKYFVPLLTTRWAGGRYSLEQQKYSEGFYRSTFRNLLQLVTIYHGNAMNQWADMTDEEKMAYRKVMTEISLIIGVNVALSIFGGHDDKKELKENSYFHNMALVTLWRARSEVEGFNFIAGWSEMIRMTRSPFIATQSIANIYNAFSLLPGTILGDEDAFYKQNSGMHSKGDSKLLVAALKASIGYTGYTFHPEEYIISFRNQANTIR